MAECITGAQNKGYARKCIPLWCKCLVACMYNLWAHYKQNRNMHTQGKMIGTFPSSVWCEAVKRYAPQYKYMLLFDHITISLGLLHFLEKIKTNILFWVCCHSKCSPNSLANPFVSEGKKSWQASQTKWLLPIFCVHISPISLLPCKLVRIICKQKTHPY